MLADRLRRPGTPGAGTPGPAARGRDRVQRMLAEVPATARRNWLFSLVLGLAAIPRIVTMLGFQPAMLFKLDSYDYLWNAVHLAPNLVNPSGYSLLLWLLRPFHSLWLIAGLQHLGGLAAAMMVYATLRRLGVREWIATLAAVPLLFTATELLLEQLIMADFLALLLMIAGFAVLLRRRKPSAGRAAVAGLLMGASSIVRPTTLPLILLMGIYLLIRRADWRKPAALVLAGAVPVLGYMAWFAAANGSFNITNSNGLFLWSRTMSFANCSVIKPSADLQALCPQRQPMLAAAPAAGSLRPQPKRFLWDHRAWMWQGTRSAGIVPDSAAFTAANNQRALRFAVRAIEAQPGAYAHVVAGDISKLFVKRIGFIFPAVSQPTSGLTGANQRYALAALRGYLGSTAGVAHDLGSHFGEHIAEPWAKIIDVYQNAAFLPGPLLALIMITGLGGLAVPHRRSAAAALLWLSAVVVVVLPVAEHEYNYRYALPAVPLAGMAAALAFRSRPAIGLAGDDTAPLEAAPDSAVPPEAAAPDSAAAPDAKPGSTDVPDPAKMD
jgi:hypothetical protein